MLLLPSSSGLATTRTPLSVSFWTSVGSSGV